MRYIYHNLHEKTLKNGTFLKFCKFNIKSWSIVFFGSDNYSLISLQGLHKQMMPKYISNIEVVVLNTRTPVYEYSVSHNIKTYIWPPNLSGIYDFGVIVSFGKFLPKTLIEKFPLGIFNVHASLLPKYRGGMPIIHAVKNGETITGVTITKINADKFDTGEIILQKSCNIDKDELMPSLYRRLSHLGCECLLEVVSNIPKSLESSFSQSNKEASYAPKLKKEHAVVKWKEMTALEIFNLHRALFGTFELTSSFKGEPIKFVCLFLKYPNSSNSTRQKRNLEPGSFVYNRITKFLDVKCKDTIISVCTVKYRNKMHRSSSFCAGYLNKLSKNFWKFES